MTCLIAAQKPCCPGCVLLYLWVRRQLIVKTADIWHLIKNNFTQSTVGGSSRRVVTLLRLLVLGVCGGVVRHVVNGTLRCVRTRYGTVLLRHKSSIGARLRVWETSGEEEGRRAFKCFSCVWGFQHSGDALTQRGLEWQRLADSLIQDCHVLGSELFCMVGSVAAAWHLRRNQMRLFVCLSLSEQQNTMKRNMSTKWVSHNFGYFQFSFLWCHVCVVIVGITVVWFCKLVLLLLDIISLPLFIRALQQLMSQY